MGGGGEGNCRTGTSTCDLGEVTVGLVLHLLPHTILELYKRKTTVEKERKKSLSSIFEWAENRKRKSKWMVVGFM